MFLLAFADAREGRACAGLVAGEIISLAEFGEHERGVGRLVLRSEGFGGATEMLYGRGVLSMTQVDVAERGMRGGEAAPVVRPCEKFERGFEQRERKVCAVATQMRRALCECAFGLTRRALRLCPVRREQVARARRRHAVREGSKRNYAGKTYREQRKIKAFGHLSLRRWTEIYRGVFRASSR
jgi:hypothetical protein